jgi:hypothetical protein
MELLATVHWVATHEPYADTSDQAISLVHQWSERKKSVMTPAHIATAWHRLTETRFLTESAGIAHADCTADASR